MAKLGPPATNKKKKKSAMEKNADLLNHENILYRSVLNPLRGTMIPDVPLAGGKGPVGFGDLRLHPEDGQGGWRFLVMERMESSFTAAVVPQLYNSRSKEVDVDVGCIMARLIRLMEGIHNTQHVFIDVKPENFMLAPSTSTTSSRTSKSGMFHPEQIRMIDLGLMESTRDVMKNKHRADAYPDGQVVGTPIYSSIRVLSGHTVSRRDDIEACIYILIELILQLREYGQSGRIKEDLLCWSQARSDEEIKRMKMETMDLDSGRVWDMIAEHGNGKLRDGIKGVFEDVRNLEFKAKPDYDDLVKRVSKWRLHLSPTSAKKNAAVGSSASSRSGKQSVKSDTTTKRKGRNNVATSASYSASSKSVKPDAASSPSFNYSYDEDVPPTATVPALSSRAARAAARAASKEKEEEIFIDNSDTNDDNDKKLKVVCDEDSDIEMISASDNASQKQHDDEDDDEMDWEVITDENDPIRSNRKQTKDKKEASSSIATTATSSSSSSSSPSLRLECIEGPHMGESFQLTSTLILGRDPGKTTSKTFALTNDTNASNKHAKLVLNVSGSKKKGVLMVKVFDLKSNSGTMVNNKMLPKGSSRQAFVKDKIQVGDSIFRISK